MMLASLEFTFKYLVKIHFVYIHISYVSLFSGSIQATFHPIDLKIDKHHHNKIVAKMSTRILTFLMKIHGCTECKQTSFQPWY